MHWMALPLKWLKTRNNGTTNHVLWMAGNLVNTRYWMAAMLGLNDKDPYEELFKEARAHNEKLDYPSLEELTTNFQSISPKVYKALLEANDEKLAEKYWFGMNIPFVEENVLNMIGMAMGRSDYLFGQIGLMCKLLGLKGMSHELKNDLNY